MKNDSGNIKFTNFKFFSGLELQFQVFPHFLSKFQIFPRPGKENDKMPGFRCRVRTLVIQLVVNAARGSKCLWASITFKRQELKLLLTTWVIYWKLSHSKIEKYWHLTCVWHSRCHSPSGPYIQIWQGATFSPHKSQFITIKNIVLWCVSFVEPVCSF